MPEEFIVHDMHCEHCQGRVEAAARSVAGVGAVAVDLEVGRLRVSGGDPQAVMAAVREAGYGIEAAQALPAGASDRASASGLPSGASVPAASYLLDLPDISCAACVARVETALQGVAGVEEASVHLLDKKALVRGGDPESALAAVRAAGYMAALAPNGGNKAEDSYCLDVEGMHCAACVTRVEAAIRSVPGVSAVSVNLVEQLAQIQGGDPEAAIRALAAQGYGAVRRTHEAGPEDFYLGIRPAPDEKRMRQIREILQARDPQAVLAEEGERLHVISREHPADILLRLTDIGWQATLEEAYEDPTQRQREESGREIRLSWLRALAAGAAGFVIMAGHMAGFFPTPQENRLFWVLLTLLCLGVMAFSGRHYYAGAWRQARHGNANMDTLVALGTGAAWLSSVLALLIPGGMQAGGGHLYLDASVMILAFLQFGHVFEVRARRTTSEAISSLVGLKARTARIIRPADETDIPVSLLRLSDHVRVRPGEKVPIDGVIIEGQSTIDESMLTGEPLAVPRGPGDAITGGTINRSGSFVLAVTRLGEDTTLARIIRMVRKAQMSKPPIGRLVDRIASVFVPVVLLIAVAAFALWLSFGPEPRLSHALTVAIAVLVIACPCALGLATPIAIMIGTSRAAQYNILIRNSEALQRAASLTHLVVDKTGTLTEGHPRVTRILTAAPYSEEEVLSRAAALESASEHPLAEAVLSAWGEKQGGQRAALLQVENFTAVSGRGVRAEMDGGHFFLGNDHFLREQNFSLPEALTTASLMAVVSMILRTVSISSSSNCLTRCAACIVFSRKEPLQLTKTPSPTRVSRTDPYSRARMASRRDGLLTPSISANCRSEGNLSPGCNWPLASSCLIWSMT